jgi:transposase-like protein
LWWISHVNENQEVETRKRRSREEVKRLVAEFEASGIRRNEFCRTRGIALSTLQRHLKRHGSGIGRAKAGNRLVAVEVSGQEPKTNSQRACALEVVLPGGRRIEVRREFDSATLGRVVKVLEGL